MSPLLLIHIAGGSVGIVSGAAALAFRKGGRLHRRSGFVFVAAMGVMGLGATALSVTLSDWANLPGGLFALYLITTGWAAVMRPGEGRQFAEQLGLVLGGAVLASALLLAFQADARPTGEINGKPAPMFLIVAGLAGFALLLDLKTLRQRDAVRRLGRHIWRMCTAFFIATGSFFLGQQQVMPDWMQGSPALMLLAFAPLVVMIVWLAKMALKRGERATPRPA